MRSCFLSENHAINIPQVIKGFVVRRWHTKYVQHLTGLGGGGKTLTKYNMEKDQYVKCLYSNIGL